MKTESEAHHTPSEFFEDTGVPEKLVMGNAETQAQGTFRKKCKEAETTRVCPGHPNLEDGNKILNSVRFDWHSFVCNPLTLEGLKINRNTKTRIKFWTI